jgi:myosin heavy subunit
MTPQQKRQCDCKALMKCALKSKEVRDANGKVTHAFAVGKTKTYFRSGALEFMEAGRSNGFDDQATIIQRAARRWLLRNGGQSKRHRQMNDMEEKMMKAARLAEEERAAKLAEEIEKLRTSRRQALEKLADEVEALDSTPARVENENTGSINAANETERAARQELDRMRDRIRNEERALASSNAALKGPRS